MLGSTNSTTINNRNTNATFTENGTYIPTEEYTGFSVVTVDVPSADEAIRQQAYTFTPSKIDTSLEERFQWDEYSAPFKVELANALDVVDEEIIEKHPELIPGLVPDLGEEWKGLGKIKIRKVGSWIDSEISRDNILAGHTILGVGGTAIENNPNPNPVYVNPRYGDPTRYISIKPGNNYNGLSEVRVNYMKTPDPYVPRLYNPGEVNVTWGETKYVTRPSGYDGLANLTIKGPPALVKKDIEIEPAIYEQTERASEYQADGFDKVKVNAVTSSIDENIKPENIRLGVTILGIEGGYLPETLETVRVTPRTIPQSIQAGGNYDAIGSVNVAAVTKDVDPEIKPENIKEGVDILGVTGTYTGAKIQEPVVVKPDVVAKTVIPNEPYDALEAVVVTGVDKTIDENIKPENILKGKSILGVEGEVLPNTLNLQAEKRIVPTLNQQTVKPDAGYDALLKLIVEAVTHQIDPNIVAENIRNNITILGITGTFRGENDYWLDLSNLAGVSVLGNKTFGGGEFSQTAIEINTNSFDIKDNFIQSAYSPISNIGAALFAVTFGFENAEITDPLLQQLYLYVQGGIYYSDYTQRLEIRDEITYIYPMENDYGIRGCLLDVEDDGSEQTLVMSVLVGFEEPRIVLSKSILSKNELPPSYTEAIYVKEITIPKHKVFKPVNSQNVITNGLKLGKEPFKQPLLTANGFLGGDSFAVAAQSYSSYPAWYAMNSNNSDYWHSGNYYSGIWYTFYNPEPIILEKISMAIYGSYCMNKYTLFGSNTNDNWQLIQSGSCATSGTVVIQVEEQNQQEFKYFRLYGDNFPSGYWIVYTFSLTAHYGLKSSLEEIVHPKDLWLLNPEANPSTEATLVTLEDSSAEITENKHLSIVSDGDPLTLNLSAIDIDSNLPDEEIFINKEKTNVKYIGGINISNDWLARGFSSNAYIQGFQPLRDNVEITLRAYLVYEADDSTSRFMIAGIDGRGFGCTRDYNSNRSWFISTGATRSVTGNFDNNSWYWVKFLQSGTNSRLFYMKDSGTYSNVDSLPAYSDSAWTNVVTVSEQIFKNVQFTIGYNVQEMNNYYRQTLDIGNLLIVVNGIEWRPVTQIPVKATTHTIQSMLLGAPIYDKRIETKNVTTILQPVYSDLITHDNTILGNGPLSQLLFDYFSPKKTDSWEMQLAFTPGALKSNMLLIRSYRAYGLYLELESGNLGLSISSNGTSWNVINNGSYWSNCFTVGKKRYLTIKYAANHYYIRLVDSLDENLRTVFYETIIGGDPVDFESTDGIKFLNDNNPTDTSNNYFTGKFYINESYIKINDEFYWAKDYVETKENKGIFIENYKDTGKEVCLNLYDLQEKTFVTEITYPQPNLTIKAFSTFNIGNTSNFDFWNTGTELKSARGSYLVTNSGMSFGYISFKSPSTVSKLSFEARISSENNCDFGVAFISTQKYTSLTRDQMLNQTLPNAQRIFAISGSIGYTSYTVSISPDTQYYLLFGYTKDGSVNAGDDRFYLRNIHFTAVSTDESGESFLSEAVPVLAPDDIFDKTKYVSTKIMPVKVINH